MYKNFTKTKKLLTVAMLLVFCAFTNNTNAQTSWNISDNSSSGNNVTATLTLADSVLTISGTGNMADFLYSATGIPWNSYLTRIKTVVINSGVTNIGDIAFQGCTNLQWVTIPEGVTIIGTRAFENCTLLHAISIPSSVTQIESQAFMNCTALKSIYNQATTPQNINSNVFQGVNLSGKYLAVPAQSVATYQSTSIWNNFTVTEPYFLIEENLPNGVNAAVGGCDGSLRYFKYQNGNPALPQEAVIYDGTSNTPAMAISFNQDGFPSRYVAADGTTFFVSGYNGNTCNGLLLTPNGNTYSVDNIDIEGFLQDINNFGINFATKVSEKIINKAIEKALSGQLPTLDATIIIEALQGSFESTVRGIVVDYVMPNEIKYLYSCYSFATKEASAISSCVFAAKVTPFAIYNPATLLGAGVYGVGVCIM